MLRIIDELPEAIDDKFVRQALHSLPAVRSHLGDLRDGEAIRAKQRRKSKAPPPQLVMRPVDHAVESAVSGGRGGLTNSKPFCATAAPTSPPPATVTVGKANLIPLASKALLIRA